ncbi:MAG: type II secretion system protein [Planctomycetota bacterium]|nr:type II secretion system protein [Planctomycetota bacterium]
MRSHPTNPSLSRRAQAGFSFIEILVVMGIIAMLASMVVALVPVIQERAKQTKSKDNVKGLVMMMVDKRMGKVTGGWPKFSGKNFTLSVVSSNALDIRRRENLEMLFSPGDPYLTLEDADQKRFEEIDNKSLVDGDFHEFTSYAGRRNADKEFLITSDQERMGTMLLCDDDDGPLHHSDGLVCGYSTGDVRFKEWEEFDMRKPDPDHPDEFLGDASSNEELQRMLGIR